MRDTKTSFLQRRRKIPFFRIIIIFLVTFFVTTTVVAAANGFYKVTAKDNHIVVVDDRHDDDDNDRDSDRDDNDNNVGGGEGRMTLLISDSNYGDYGETIEAPIDVMISTTNNSYVFAGDIFVKNSSSVKGMVKQECRNLNGGYLNDVIGLKVTRSNSETFYEGTLREYCLNRDGKGNFHMDPNVVYKLMFYVKYNHKDSFSGVKSVFDNLNGYPQDQINFDLSFRPV